MLLRRFRTRYKGPNSYSLLHPSQAIVMHIHAKSTNIPCPTPMPENFRFINTSMRNASRIPTQHPWSSCHHCYVHMISIPIPKKNSLRFPIPDCVPCGWEVDVPKFEMLASLQRQLCLCLARCALQSQHNLLCGLGLLVEHRLRLTTITGLFTIITTLSLREQRCLLPESDM